jgi:hypothetical protein
MNFNLAAPWAVEERRARLELAHAVPVFRHVAVEAALEKRQATLHRGSVQWFGLRSNVSMQVMTAFGRIFRKAIAVRLSHEPISSIVT